MSDTTPIMPIGIKLSCDIEYRGNEHPAETRYRARVRWTDPGGGGRKSLSSSVATEPEAEAWIERMERAALRGISPNTFAMTMTEYGESVWALAMRGLAENTVEGYEAGWRLRVLPLMGHFQVTAVTNGITDRVLSHWIETGIGKSRIKQALSALVRVMEQAVRDGIIERNPCRMAGWQKLYTKIEAELDDPRSLALADWDALDELANALVARSHGNYRGWGDVVRFAACTAARIGEVSGVRVKDINRVDWTWNLSRQTTLVPGGLKDKETKGKRSRPVPLIEEIREMVKWRLTVLGDQPDARLFTGPRGGRISTNVLRDATHWDEVVVKLGYEHLRRHDLRHTGLTWMADAGVPLHVLKEIAGHGHISTTERYLHPSRRSIEKAGDALSAHLIANRREPEAPVPPSAARTETHQEEEAPIRHLRVVR